MKDFFSTDSVVAITHGRCIQGRGGERFSGISIDSRTVCAGALFIALRGERFDGHAFIEEACAKGASGVLAQAYTPSKAYRDRTIIIVKDSLRALGDIAAHYKSRHRAKTVAITGSAGKTTTKEMLAAILGARYEVLKNEGTKNNLIGVPLTLLKLAPHHQACVTELGTNKFGEIKRLAEIALPDIAIITNIGPAHLEFFKDIRGVRKEKADIFSYMKKSSLAFLPYDDTILITQAKKKGLSVVTFGEDARADFAARITTRTAQGTSFVVNGSHEFFIKAKGDHFVKNALASIACARELGMTQAAVREALAERFLPVSMRMKEVRCDGITFIDDTYNANPLSVSCAIEFLSSYRTRARKVLIISDMLELGEASVFYHKEIAHFAREKNIDVVIAVGTLSRVVAEEAKKAGMPEDNVLYFQTKEALLETVQKLLKPHDVVLVKGSRKMQMEDVIQCFTGCLSR